MQALLNELKFNISKWRDRGPDDYWIVVSYVGGEFNRLGDHTLTIMGDDIYDQVYDGSWRKINKGSDYWLFTVPGTYAWARDLITKVLPDAGGDASNIEIEYGPMGQITHVQIRMPSRDAHNLTLDVRGFGAGQHENFTKPE